MMRRSIHLLCAGALLLAAMRARASRETEELWDNRVAPVLDRHCTKCHAGVRQKSGLDLRSLETILRGGERGPAIIPGKPGESRLIQFALPDSDPHMPPEGKKQLTPEEIDSLRLWVSKLPAAKSPLASADSTNTTWVAGYLEDLRRSEKPRFVPPAEMPAAEAIDAILRSDWREAKITPAPECDDRAFVRRIYLDLAGRIPAPAETERFLADKSPKKREELLDRILEDEDYPRRMREVFDVALMGRPKKNNAAARRDHGWNAFLDEAFRINQPWNKTVREIIEARATNGPAKGASWYLYERHNNYQAMAEAIAPAVFGVQIKCAQCHNHPLAWEIEQRHYWGLVAAFNRSKNVETESGAGVAESAIGGFVQFANLKKESQPAVLAFLNGKVVPEKRPAENEKETDRSDLYLVPPPNEGKKAAAPAVPKFSRRKALADAVTEDNPLLARAFVNRIWELLMGRGIVHPVDKMDSRHRPSHPVLLEWLAADFQAHGYDVKRLIRGIVLSRAYQLGSEPSGKTSPPPSSFAQALDKPLTAEQLFRSLLVVSGRDPKSDSKEFAELQRALIKKFPEVMPAVYNASIEQALFWSNSAELEKLLAPAGENMAARLAALDSPGARVDKAFLAVLGRKPEGAERQQCSSLAAKDLLWVLVSSAEFQLNH